MCSPKFGSEVWPNTTNYKESLGLGKQQIVRASKHLWPESLVVQTRQIGEKKGSKRHVLVDENGIPISLLVSAANQHDSVALEPLGGRRFTGGNNRMPLVPGCRVRW